MSHREHDELARYFGCGISIIDRGRWGRDHAMLETDGGTSMYKLALLLGVMCFASYNYAGNDDASTRKSPQESSSERQAQRMQAREEYLKNLQKQDSQYDDAMARGVKIVAMQEAQMTRADRLLTRQEEQSIRMDRLLTKQEEQAKRFDAVLDRWEKSKPQK